MMQPVDFCSPKRDVLITSKRKGMILPMRSFHMSIIALVLIFVSSANADSIPPPDIHSQSLQEYIGNDIANWKILHSIYVISLEEELDSLATEIRISLENIPPAETLFWEAHSAFMLYSTAQSGYEETVQWYDITTGEAYFGSGGGYLSLSVLSSLYWQRILYYREILKSTSAGDFLDSHFQLLPDSLTGGY